MVVQPMQGVKVVEVAQFTFAPSAGAVLADWGAEVIKVEHAVTGDAQRGLTIGAGGAAEGSFQPLMEHPNRGKRSIGLALEIPSAHAVLMELVRDADVFITNFLPSACHRLRIEVDDLRSVNPGIIYVRGSGHGPHGPDAQKAGFDGSTFWARTGSAWGSTPPDSPSLIRQPAGAYGDSLGGAIMAGGIAAALFARDRTGEPSVVDVSLMSVGAWAMALSLTTALLTDEVTPAPPLTAPPNIAVNPVIGNYRTSDDRFITLMMVQPGRHFSDLCAHLGLEQLLEDDRFSTAEGLITHADEIGRQIAEAFSEKPYAHWVQHLASLTGPWSPVQNPLETATDPQMHANGYIVTVTDAEGAQRHLVANPVQFDETPPTLTRAPQFAEHTDDILRSLGKDDDALIELKIDGACT
ncbi:crotonobetainyl-CoA:carnitine CoA-transferase CaiB-like acyl-CoA transferase [Mycolicibacterium sp. BK556]|uniref:CaiB/BaiF CoA transferase family protein n=1 Tax=unclassified Mycolicibacterium TaxID=2636767 RepID=UPI000D4D6827|nr:crotonobetainyl-CoA:carnitine CoA-transferase CaiB-like acyl-CoA transferase [Mycolicibacterium sp. BK556]MBB3636231.1 crotonobetainyl-CoA:carnitine CoA-transferase CaiB-like acyl-CoA transferase [Mycolicibacterium sp. BK607]MBB3753523.1 crotonobetainyl-CoA:carnitine CoA-transferase CaiB-like acyl-CoA transferase [Mycolicibacterium sp. BK634]